ncbi:hypothetical protein EXS54_01215 [Patescibacteria group bacterium]|nr:hypothetical protein [Patescibacteria group bacterium]
MAVEEAEKSGERAALLDQIKVLDHGPAEFMAEHAQWMRNIRPTAIEVEDMYEALGLPEQEIADRLTEIDLFYTQQAADLLEKGVAREAAPYMRLAAECRDRAAHNWKQAIEGMIRG